MLHSYGPEKLIGSVHIEVDEAMTVPQLDSLERKMTADIYQKHGVILEGISIYSVNLSDSETNELFHAVRDEVTAYDQVLQLHGFHFDKENALVIFDLIISFDEKDRQELCDKIVHDLQEKYPDYRFCVTLDSDISD